MATQQQPQQQPQKQPMNHKIFKYLLLLCSFFYAQISNAATISWVDWSYIDSTNFSGDVNGVNVSFSGDHYDFHYPVSGGSTNFWNHPASVADNTYTASPTVENGPSDSDIIVMREAGTRTITFDQAVVNPVMSILSMGSSSTAVQYAFDSDFDILSVGAGTFDPSGNGTLEELSGNILSGVEGHGLIQFTGTFTSISWTSNVYEDFHGIQIGVESTVVPVPAAAWLFASGLIGLLGFSRRNNYKK